MIEQTRNYCLRSLYNVVYEVHIMLIHGSHVNDLRCETKFEVCDPQSF